MDNQELLSRIVIDPSICHGKPVIRGMRYTVQKCSGIVGIGYDHQEIIADFTDLEDEDIRACLLFASRIADVKSISSLVAWNL